MFTIRHKDTILTLADDDYTVRVHVAPAPAFEGWRVTVQWVDDPSDDDGPIWTGKWSHVIWPDDNLLLEVLAAAERQLGQAETGEHVPDNVLAMAFLLVAEAQHQESLTRSARRRAALTAVA